VELSCWLKDLDENTESIESTVCERCGFWTCLAIGSLTPSSTGQFPISTRLINIESDDYNLGLIGGTPTGWQCSIVPLPTSRSGDDRGGSTHTTQDRTMYGTVQFEDP